jgi:SagB-type dehydrogenase family enzyme
MSQPESFFRLSELDRTNWAETRDAILQYEQEPAATEPRTYPGYPRWPLDRVKSRLWPSLDRSLIARRSWRRLDTGALDKKMLSRLLFFSHGIHADHHRGPIPSAGGLQAVELYLVLFEESWLPPGLYHYDRAGHHLSQIAAGAERETWLDMVPALRPVGGGRLLWVLVGDGARVEAKYGARGLRFLLLEAGHLMQNLCLLSTSLGWATLPLGGYFEREVARALVLPASDLVLYVGVCGKPLPH